MARRDFLLTVDVEALPKRATRDRVARLVWGDFGQGEARRAGIREMVAVAGDAGVPITFFVDMAETRLYGDAFRECARFIHESGNDAELHLHPELLPKAYWIERFGMVPKPRTQEHFDEPVADALFREFSADLVDATGQPGIVAYRAGSFRIGRAMLLAQARAGIPLTSNLSYESFLNQKRFPLAPPDAGPFRWKEGPIEVPITQIRQGRNWKVLSLPMKLDGLSYEEVFAALAAADRADPVVMILHSWSLLNRRPDSKEMFRSSKPMLERFGAIARAASRQFNCIDFRALHARIRADALPLGRERPFPDKLNRYRHLAQPPGHA